MSLLLLRLCAIGVVVIVLATCALGRNFHQDSLHAKDFSKVETEGNDKSDFKCPSAYGSFPDVEDCSQRYVCIGGVSTIKKCPRNTQFDKNRKQCLPLNVAVCDTGPTTKKPPATTTEDDITTETDVEFKCPSLSGRFMNPEDCSKFYTCKSFKPALKTCPALQLFDGVRKVCRPQNKVHCGNRIKPTGSTTEEPPATTTKDDITTEEGDDVDQDDFECPSCCGKFADIENCTRYYACAGWESTHLSCPRLLRFDKHRRMCLPFKVSECDTGSTTEELVATTKADAITTEKGDDVVQDDFECPSCCGKFPDIEDCNRYYVCDDGVSTHLSCPRLLRFDKHRRMCLPFKVSECHTGSTTEEPPATTTKDDITTEKGDDKSNFKCPSAYGSFPDVEDCSQRYVCIGGVSTIKKCPRNTQFDKNRKQCLPLNVAECDTGNKVFYWPWDKSNFKCPSPFGSFPDIEDCSQYYVCVGGVSTLRKCQRMKQFDKYRKQCMPFIVAVCDTGSTTVKPPATTTEDDITTEKDVTFKCPSLYGQFMHPEDCSKFYTCTFFIPALKTCPLFQLFDEVKKDCRPEDSVHCGNRIRPTGSTTVKPPATTTEDDITTEKDATFKCPSLYGEFMYPEDCSKYYTCTFFIPTLKSCPPFQLFDGVKKDCKPEDSVHCGNRIRPTEPPKTTTTPEPEPETSPEPEPTPEPETTVSPTTTEVTTTEKEKVTAPETSCSEDDVDCIIEDLGEKPKWFKCPKDMGSYPHPSSKKLFIFCLNWQPKVKKCGQNLVFSDKLLTCVSP